MKVIPGEFQHALVVADIEESKECSEKDMH